MSLAGSHPVGYRIENTKSLTTLGKEMEKVTYFKSEKGGNKDLYQLVNLRYMVFYFYV